MENPVASVALGCVARDTISGFKGVVTCYSKWLNGCVRVTISPMGLRDGKPIEDCTFDEQQVERLAEDAAEYESRIPPKPPTGGNRPSPPRHADAKR